MARGRSCTSILVIPRRKMALVRAWEAAMAELELHETWPWGLTGEEGKGKRREGQGHDCWLGGRGLGGSMGWGVGVG
jgi:hypothetical protein